MSKWSNITCPTCGYRLEYCVCPEGESVSVTDGKATYSLEAPQKGKKIYSGKLITKSPPHRQAGKIDPPKINFVETGRLPHHKEQKIEKVDFSKFPPETPWVEYNIALARAVNEIIDRLNSHED